ncbi:hypothetical protein BC332_10255 [Capsicum chinense]|nr:hypothetical protein BC332_10255 [Capsicum chinense]
MGELARTGLFVAKSVCYSPLYRGWARGPGVSLVKNRLGCAREAGEHLSVSHLSGRGHFICQMGKTARTGHFGAKSEDEEHPSVCRLCGRGHWFGQIGETERTGHFGVKSVFYSLRFWGGTRVRGYHGPKIDLDIPGRPRSILVLPICVGMDIWLGKQEKQHERGYLEPNPCVITHGSGDAWAKNRPAYAREAGGHPSISCFCGWHHLVGQTDKTVQTGHFGAKLVCYSSRFQRLGVWQRRGPKIDQGMLGLLRSILVFPVCVGGAILLVKRAKWLERGILGPNQYAIAHGSEGGHGVRVLCGPNIDLGVLGRLKSSLVLPVSVVRAICLVKRAKRGERAILGPNWEAGKHPSVACLCGQGHLVGQTGKIALIGRFGAKSAKLHERGILWPNRCSIGHSSEGGLGFRRCRRLKIDLGVLGSLSFVRVGAFGWSNGRNGANEAFWCQIDVLYPMGPGVTSLKYQPGCAREAGEHPIFPSLCGPGQFVSRTGKKARMGYFGAKLMCYRLWFWGEGGVRGFNGLKIDMDMPGRLGCILVFPIYMGGAICTRFRGWAWGLEVSLAKNRLRHARKAKEHPNVPCLCGRSYFIGQKGEMARTGHFGAKSAYDPEVVWDENGPRRAKEVVKHPSIAFLCGRGRLVVQMGETGLFGAKSGPFGWSNGRYDSNDLDVGPRSEGAGGGLGVQMCHGQKIDLGMPGRLGVFYYWPFVGTGPFGWSNGRNGETKAIGAKSMCYILRFWGGDGIRGFHGSKTDLGMPGRLGRILVLPVCMDGAIWLFKWVKRRERGILGQSPFGWSNGRNDMNWAFRANLAWAFEALPYLRKQVKDYPDEVSHPRILRWLPAKNNKIIKEVVHPWIVPTEQELGMTSFITLGFVDTLADPTVDLIKKELAGVIAIRRAVREDEPNVEALHDQPTATDLCTSSRGVAG